MTQEIEIKTLSDNRLTAFCSLEGHEIREIKNNDAVFFEARGRGLSETIKKYYNNPEVKLFDYFRHFDLVRDLVRGAK